MISGFNTDVEHHGQVFHVQTEEKGPANPVVVSLVYCGGQIVGSLEMPYGTPESAEAAVEDEIRVLMREQHSVLIRGIRSGKFDPPPMPYGHEFVTGRSLDELVIDYLEQSIDEIGAPPAGSAAGEAAAAGDAPGPGRAVHVARVLHRLERFLDAAQRAAVERAEAVEAEVPAAAPTSPEPPPVASPEPPRSIATAPAIAPGASPRPPGRGRSWKRLAVAAALAAIAGTTAWMLLPGTPDTAGTEPAIVTASPAPAEPSAAEPSGADLAGVPQAPLESALAAPAAEPLEPPPESEPAQNAVPPAADPPARERAPAPSRRTDRAAVRAAAPVPPPQATHPEVAPSTPPPAIEPPEPLPDRAATSLETAVQAGQLVDLASVDVTPRPRRRDLPRYTGRARRGEQQGVVELRMLIDERGEVAEVELVRDDAGAELAQESLFAVRSWTFSPARKERQPVKVWQDVAIEFSILPNRSTSVRIRD